MKLELALPCSFALSAILKGTPTRNAQQHLIIPTHRTMMVQHFSKWKWTWSWALTSYQLL
jgi:hypothetical protein